MLHKVEKIGGQFSGSCFDGDSGYFFSLILRAKVPRGTVRVVSIFEWQVVVVGKPNNGFPELLAFAHGLKNPAKSVPNCICDSTFSR